MKQAPMLYSAAQLKEWDVSKSKMNEFGKEYWLPARPLSASGIKARFILAIKVFRGECDALWWDE